MKGVLFHQDNAPAHKSLVAMAAVCYCGFELVNHPPYSPDLAPSDYILFPNMQKNTWLRSSIGPNDEVISAVEDFFEDQDESFYTIGIQALQHRWKKCVDRRGDYMYVEKLTTFGQIQPLHHSQPKNFSAHPHTSGCNWCEMQTLPTQIWFKNHTDFAFGQLVSFFILSFALLLHVDFQSIHTILSVEEIK